MVSYTIFRVLACTALALLACRDIAVYAPPPGDAARSWAAALIGVGCFDGLLLLSLHWYFHDILPMLHAGLQVRTPPAD